MNSFAQIIDLWPSHQDLGEDIGEKSGTIAVWKHRDSIPPAAWLRLVGAAHARGFSGVTLELLAQLAARTAARSIA